MLAVELFGAEAPQMPLPGSDPEESPERYAIIFWS